MFHLTKEEHFVLWVLISIILTGSFFNIVFKKYPCLKDTVNLIETDVLYPKLNINTAGEEELENLPFIGVYTAHKIVEYREQNGEFNQLEDVRKVSGIKDKNFEKFKSYLKLND